MPDLKHVIDMEESARGIRHRAALLMRFFEALSHEDRGGINTEIDQEAAIALEDFAREIRHGAEVIENAIAEREDKEVLSCLRRAEVTGSDPAEELRSRGLTEVADLLEQSFGKAPRRTLKKVQA